MLAHQAWRCDTCAYKSRLLTCSAALQLIIERAYAGEKDHVKHALDLFVDFAAIFVRILVRPVKHAQWLLVTFEVYVSWSLALSIRYCFLTAGGLAVTCARMCR